MELFANDHPSRGVLQPQIKPPGLEPDLSGPSRASLSHRIPAGTLLPRRSSSVVWGVDSVAVHPINLPSLSVCVPSPIPAVLPVLTQETKPAERTVNGKAPRRPRESKKEAVSLCSRGGMRKCPRSVSNLSEGGQATFSRRGKARQRRSSHRRAGLQLHRPEPGIYGREKKKKKERKEKIQRRAWFRRAISRVCLCPMTPPTILQPPSPPHPLRSVAVRVCEHNPPPPPLLLLLHPPPPPRLSVSAAGLVQSEGMGG